MLGTTWVSSRLGAKQTLVAGLAIIVVFAALAGLSDSIGGIVGFRAGWDLGNARIIATSLAVIVASASGGFAGAIVLYEAALGPGLAAGPLVGGPLGSISWRGPFFGVAVLMASALLATVVLLAKTPKPTRKTALSAPLRALRHRGLLTMAITALRYNWGLFTMLGYAPFRWRSRRSSADHLRHRGRGVHRHQQHLTFYLAALAALAGARGELDRARDAGRRRHRDGRGRPPGRRAG